MDPAAHRTHVLHWIDVGTTATFGVEAALKIVAFGFRPYLSFNTNKVGAAWVRALCSRATSLCSKLVSPCLRAAPPTPHPTPLLQLDLGVLVVSSVVLVVQAAVPQAQVLRVLRVLRAVRPLRMLTRSQSMLMVFHTLVRSLAAMGNVTGDPRRQGRVLAPR